MKFQNKKAAIELSIGTIIIIVLGVSMLILGMILVRSIMCSAIGLTGDVNTKVTDELNKYFGESQAEVACVGEGTEAIKMPTGKDNIVYCAIHTTEQAKYEITMTKISTSIPSLTQAQLDKWVTTNSWSGEVAPGDSSLKKVVRIKVPSDAPEGDVIVSISITKDGTLIGNKDLDFQTSRVGLVQGTIC